MQNLEQIIGITGRLQSLLSENQPEIISAVENVQGADKLLAAIRRIDKFYQDFKSLKDGNSTDCYRKKMAARLISKIPLKQAVADDNIDHMHAEITQTYSEHYRKQLHRYSRTSFLSDNQIICNDFYKATENLEKALKDFGVSDSIIKFAESMGREIREVLKPDCSPSFFNCRR